jgi:His-Xaa-Ser system radical SAM maturase HxsB
MLSTSLDGPCWIHDKHRQLRLAGSSYKVFVEKLKMARDALGYDCASALMTSTADSLDNIKEIVDEYVKLGFGGVFFRSLNPYGDAYEKRLCYSPEHYFKMFKEGLEYIVDINKKGTRFVEYYTAILMQRIITPFSTGFVDLQSPSGAGISGVIYDYTGDVYPADEARMLARMGDTRFRMGNVFKNTFKEIFLSDVLKNILSESCVETIPGCSSCVYRTYCGVDVFRNYLETGDIANVRMEGFFCRKQTQIFDYLFERIQDPEFMSVIKTWIGG